MSNLDISIIKKSLMKIRASIRSWNLITSISYFIVAVSVVIFISLFVDRVFRMDYGQRLFFLISGAIFLMFIFFKKVILPMYIKITDEQICQAIEKRTPELSNKLVSGYQFALMNNPEVYGYSNQLVNESINEAISAVNRFEIKKIFDSKLYYKMLMGGFAGISLISLFLFYFPKEFKIWTSRNIYLSEVQWPRQTILKIHGVKNNSMELPMHDDLNISVEANTNGVIPDLIELKLNRNGLITYHQLYKANNNEYRYQISHLKDNVKFQVKGGDDVSNWIDVKLIERPVIEDLKLFYVPPEYTGIKNKNLVVGQSLYQIIAGSEFFISGNCSKNLSVVELHANGSLVKKIEKINSKKFLVDLNKDDLKTGVYEIKLIDQSGTSNYKAILFNTEVLKDNPPVIDFKIPVIGNSITKQARIPIKWTVTDDFGIKEIGLSMRMLNQKEEEANLYIDEILKNEDKSKKSFSNKELLKLGDYKMDIGHQLIITMTGNDFNILNNSQGKSPIFKYQLISVEALRKELFEREQELRADIVRQKKEEESIYIETVRLMETLNTRKSFNIKDIAQIRKIEKKQKLMGNKNLFVVKMFNQILTATKINLLDDDELDNSNRIKNKITKPLLNITENLIPAVILKFKFVSIKNDYETNLNKLLVVKRNQDKIIKVYESILKNMSKWEGYYETVSLLKEIIKEQKKLQELTEKSRKDNIKGVFDE
ncbi:MAG: hypothetical protein COA79_13570 [Planctomycetota bacterium]|nr:MAG: hypothetical protein COA79_13570 [Planctomycetota bacterium]